MTDIEEIIKLLESADIYEAALKLAELIGEDQFLKAVNGDPKAMIELGHKLIEKAKDIEEGPQKVKDKKFLQNLNRLRDR